MKPRPIILDCDPGVDDALAILLALASPQEIEVLGITAVAGNLPLEVTALNARKICALAGRRDVPVHAGCSRPMLRSPVTAEAWHGESGLGNATLPEPETPLRDRHAVDFIVDTLKAGADKEITLCPIGPLTNIALAIVKAPEIVDQIREIVLMGGAIGEGNTTPSAEFNIYADPHAAHVVFTSGAQIIMFGLDVTHRALTTPDRLGAIKNLNTPVTRAVADMLDFYDRHNVERYGEPGAPLHDPCVIAYLLNRGLFSGRDVHVAIETASELTMGRTVVDWWQATGNTPNAQVISKLDAAGYYNLILERLGRLPIS